MDNIFLACGTGRGVSTIVDIHDKVESTASVGGVCTESTLRLHRAVSGRKTPFEN